MAGGSRACRFESSNVCHIEMRKLVTGAMMARQQNDAK
jgi:hypothetical protein